MSQTAQILIGLVFVVGAFVASQVIVARRLRRAAQGILNDLERLNALDPASAVELGYAKPNLLRVGLRDMRPRALEDLTRGNIVGKTAAGKLFLKTRPTPVAIHGADTHPDCERR